MTLAQLLESRFRGDVRFRGADYLKAERVALTRVTPNEVHGSVREAITDFHVQLRRVDGRIQLHCGCPQIQAPESTCRHMWAVILAADAAGLCNGMARHGEIPPFIPEEPVPTLVNGADHDDDGDIPGVPLRGEWDRDRAPKLVTRLRDWESQLLSLRDVLQTSEPASGKTRPDREIYYEIDIGQSRAAGQLVIQTSQRQRRAGGQWSKLKPIKLRSLLVDEFEGADRPIVGYLCGSVADRATPAGLPDPQWGSSRFIVPHGLAELVLPLMSAARRLQFLTEEGAVLPPLVWDDGPPWELVLHVDLDEQDQKWELTGLLRRGDERLTLSEAVLLLPGGLVFTSARAGRLRDGGALHWLSLLRKPDPLRVPRDDADDLVDRLLDMPIVPRLELPPELRLDEVVCEPVPQLSIQTPRNVRWQQERLLAEVHFNYLDTLVRASGSEGSIVQREQNRFLPRDRAREDRAWQELLQAGFKRVLDPVRSRCDVEIPARSLGPAVRALIDQGWHVRADGLQVRQARHLQFEVKSHIDWFELHGQVDFSGATVPFPELLAALSRGDSTVRLDDGSLGILPDEWFSQYSLLSGLGVAEGDHLRFARNQVGLLDALLAAQSVDLDAPFRLLRDKLRNFERIEVHEQPEGFVGTLRDYQREGLGWLQFLQEFGFGGCLADDMGLGKTVQLLALLVQRRAAGGEHRASLVVVPKSLIFNWQQECDRFTPTLRVLEYTGLERAELRRQIPKADVVLTTYGTLRRDVLHLKDLLFDYVVLDEAQAIKNARSQVAKAARLLQARHRLALSGTPIENRLGDLWSIFEFLNPGMLGRASVFDEEMLDGKGAAARETLSRALRPFILRRTKRQVASELPDKLEQTIHCQMGEAQARQYNELRDHYRSTLLGLVRRDGIARSKLHVLEALLRLRQAACHPALLDPSVEDEASAKLETLIWHLEELLAEGHKALVFSQFTSMLAIVRKHLDKKGIVYEYLDGQTRKRREHVERFQNDPRCGVFLISLKAGGLGLNLTAADYVFILDPWWNPAVEAQAIDRAHRIGQVRTVFAYRLICRDTVEEKIAQLQEHKKDLADAILQADNNLVRDLTAEDLELLLS